MISQDDDALIERCNELEDLLRCVLEDARADYEDEKGKCFVSSELIEKIFRFLNIKDQTFE
jgi:hypothetical protein